jgi:O-antigen/teichoic acid export membrane protein
LAQFALPLLSNLNGEKDLRRYGKTLRLHLVLTAAASTFVALPVAVAAPYIMSLYGRNFEEGWPVLVLAAATAVIACVNGVVGTAILSSGSVWANCAFNAMWAIVFLTACQFLIPRYLSLGLATSAFIAYIAHTAWQAIYLRRTLRRVEQTTTPALVA